MGSELLSAERRQILPGARVLGHTVALGRIRRHKGWAKKNTNANTHTPSSGEIQKQKDYYTFFFNCHFRAPHSGPPPSNDHFCKLGVWGGSPALLLPGERESKSQLQIISTIGACSGETCSAGRPRRDPLSGGLFGGDLALQPMILLQPGIQFQNKGKCKLTITTRSPLSGGGSCV